MSFFTKSPAAPLIECDEATQKKRFKRMQWSTFIAITLGYSMYYVCRTGLNVVKKPIMDAGILDATQLGLISSALLFTYAIGKLVNGFLADHSNIKRFMATGLLLSTIANVVVGLLGLITVKTMTISITLFYLVFAVMWAINGWSQSMGAPPSVVALSRWCAKSNRGTFYGFWSLSHNLGEGLSFVFVGAVVAMSAWYYGLIGAAVAGLIGIIIIIFMLHDSPEAMGMPPVAVLAGEEQQEEAQKQKSVGKAQLGVLKNPYVWILALASAFMYVSRYAVNGWGVPFLQEKGFDLDHASYIIAINAIFGIIGTACSGWISDTLFKGNRYIPAITAGLLEIIALVMFAYGGSAVWINILAMVIFGVAIGILICFLGGLMVVDIVPREASGAALGVVGVASYAGAGLQDIISGHLIDANKVLISAAGEPDLYRYDFSAALQLWIAAAAASLALMIYIYIHTKRRPQSQA
ncbi:MAG: MFS transporter [Paludibacteraceae bacterium]|nr:MFS transporter [Paludibacteraceae bacterium]